jgi:hypothetical protein
VKVSRNRTPSSYAARFDPGAFSGHSLRTGFVTSAVAHGASLFKMMDVSRQRSVDTPRAYVRDADAFQEQRLRWGAPAESNEASTCKRYAPAAQREKMSKFAPGSTSGAGRHAAQLSERQQRWPSVRPLRVVICKTCS